MDDGVLRQLLEPWQGHMLYAERQLFHQGRWADLSAALVRRLAVRRNWVLAVTVPLALISLARLFVAGTQRSDPQAEPYMSALLGVLWLAFAVRLTWTHLRDVVRMRQVDQTVALLLGREPGA